MVFDGARAAGYFSGGCIEADVANHAQQVLADGKPKRLVYGKGSPWIDIRLTCGGSLTILLERIEPGDVVAGRLRECRDRRLVAHWSSNGSERSAGEGESCVIAGQVYSKTFFPTWRLVVTGGNPIALALVALAAQCGMEAILLRSAPAASPMPIAGVSHVTGGVGAALEKASPDRWTAVIAASHDDDRDDAIIRMALASDAPYVGVLGSARRVAARNLRMEAAGLSSDQCQRIVSPIGLPGCGRSAWEVSVSVMAQLLQIRATAQTSED
jgi:xanthine dehydrogenase accessory factor